MLHLQNSNFIPARGASIRGYLLGRDLILNVFIRDSNTLHEYKLDKHNYFEKICKSYVIYFYELYFYKLHSPHTE